MDVRVFARWSPQLTISDGHCRLKWDILEFGKVPTLGQPLGAVVSDMGKVRDAAQSKSAPGKKRDLGWKLIYIVTVMGFLGMLQLFVVEHRWYSFSSRHKEFLSLPHIAGLTAKTPLKRTLATSTGRSATSQHALHPSKFRTLVVSVDTHFSIEIRVCHDLGC